MTNVHESGVVQAGDTERRMELRESSRWRSPGCILAGVVGVVSGVVGLVVVVRTGIDGSLDRPVTEILGTNMSAIVGLVLLVAGLLLVLSSASEASRPVAGAIGAILVIAGVVGAAATASMRSKIGMDAAAGWFVAGVGALSLVAAMLPAQLMVHREIAHDRVRSR